MKKNKYGVWLVMMILTLIIGTSYAIWQLTFTQTESNIVNTTCFKIDFTEKNDITLQSAYPITDAEGMSLTPSTFTIENICDTNATYQINLETLKGDGKRLSDEYLKLSLNDEKGKSLNTLSEVLPTLSSASHSHKLTTGVLKVGEKKEFSLRLWMSEDTPPIDEVMNATHESKVTVTLIHKENIPNVTTLASEYLDGIKVQNTVSNLENDVLTYFYKLDDESEVRSNDANYTFTGLNDGTYKVSVRIENQDGIMIKEESQDVVIAYAHVYVSNSGNDTTGIGSMENPFLTLQPAYNKVKSGGEVLLLSDITVTSTTNMNIENKSVTLKSNGETPYTILKDTNFTTQILDLTNTNTLTTTNIIFDGNEVISSAALIEAHNSTLNLNEGTTLQKNNNRGRYYNDFNNSGALGSGVFAYQSTINIHGASILHNKISVQSGAWGSGAGLQLTFGTLNFDSGNISYNECIGTIGNQLGGGISLLEGTINMSGGILSYNKTVGASAGGVWVNSSSLNTVLNMTGGSIIYNQSALSGAGVTLFREPGGTSTTTFYHKGGVIENNIAPNNADIVNLEDGTFYFDQR